LAAEYIQKKAKRVFLKKIFNGIGKSLDLLDFIQAVTDDDVKIGDDLYEICVQRGVKKPKTASEAT